MENHKQPGSGKSAAKTANDTTRPRYINMERRHTPHTNTGNWGDSITKKKGSKRFNTVTTVLNIELQKTILELTKKPTLNNWERDFLASMLKRLSFKKRITHSMQDAITAIVITHNEQAA